MLSRSGASRGLPDGYELVDRLGEGSSGTVVLARQPGLHRLVAVKIVATGVRSTTGRLRLEREAQVIVELQHPHIVEAIRLHAWRGGASLVMEYLPGGDLRTALRAGALTRTQTASLLEQVAGALEHAHARQIVHRDVKPANILLTRRDDSPREAKIADFGLARLPRAAGAFRTSAGSSSGTPLYMAPEQITEPDAEAPSMDVYAFGVLAYQSLVGAPPYPAPDLASLMHAHLHDEPVPPWHVIGEFSRPLGQTLLATLAKDPKDRATLEELRRSIHQVSTEEWAWLDELKPPPKQEHRPVPTQTAGTTTATTTRTSETVTSSATATSTGTALDEEPAQPPPVTQTASLHQPRPQLLPSNPYRPPRQPFLRRRSTYLSVALVLGSALGVAFVVLAGLR